MSVPPRGGARVYPLVTKRQSDAMIQLASGQPLPRGQDGQPAYRGGQLALGAVLVDLPRHIFDREKSNHVARVLEALDLVPDDILYLVAEEIDALAECRKLKCQPRLPEIKNMCAAALRMNASVLSSLASRQHPRTTTFDASGPQRRPRVKLRRPVNKVGGRQQGA